MVDLGINSLGAGPPVVLVHGWAGMKEGWPRLPSALADAGLRALAVDLPGWGDRPAPRRFAHTADAYAAWLVDLLGDVGPAALVAHSMGCQAALLAARDRPDLVRRLVLIAPAALPFRPAKFPPRSMRDLIRYPVIGIPATRIALLWLRRSPGRWRRQFLRAFADPQRHASDPALADTLDVVSRRLTCTSTRTLAHSGAHLLRFDARPLAAQVEVPALVVSGRRDRAVAEGGAEALVTLMPQARSLRVAAAAHFPHIEDRPRVIPAIVEYLAS